MLATMTLRARPTLSLEEPLNPLDILTTPVVISNDGMLPLNNVDVATFIIDVRYLGGGEQYHSIGVNYVPPSRELDIGEKRTVPFREFVNKLYPPIFADVLMVVSFNRKYIPFSETSRAFRFVTQTQADGKLRFEQQPAGGDIIDEYERELAIHLRDLKLRRFPQRAPGLLR